jgi:small subunit ribosomal protein S6
MAEKWRRYETLMIFDPDLGPDGTEELVQKSREFVTQGEGRVLKTERWGVREMAFEVKGRRKGYYLLLEYAGLPRVASEMDRRLNLIDTVVKFQTIKLQEAVDPATLPEPVEIMPEVTPPVETPKAAVAESGDDEEEGAETADSDDSDDEGED